MQEIVLRPYQKNQINFIESRIDISDVVAIESPTGSGKTFVMLEFVKRWLSKPENHLTNVIISTGFNNLVYLMEKRAKEIGLNPKILIGTKACNCPVLMEQAGLEPKVFTEDENFKCGDLHKHLDVSTDNENQKVCPYTQQMYREYYQSITNNVGQLIITNHSSLLVHQEYLSNSSLLIIDEAHTFATFYDNYLKLELDKNDLISIDRAINKLKEPMKSIIKMNMQRGVNLPSLQLEKICEGIGDTILKAKTKEFFETSPNIGNYIERNSNRYTIDKFYRYFKLDIKPKIILFSATMDEFTLNMFNVRKSNFYKEYEIFCDYTKSEFIAIPNDSYEKSLLMFLDYVNEKNLESGLILSTTIHDMNLALQHDGKNGYKMFTNINDYEKYEGKKALVGSKALFQGVDIPNVKFVCLNKIPFPTWDDKTKAQQNYLTNNGTNDFDPWNQFTIPKTENDLIQSTGRLWRSIDSFGVVSLFDPRVEKFKYIMRHVFDQYRHGINTSIMRENGEIEKFDIKK